MLNAHTLKNHGPSCLFNVISQKCAQITSSKLFRFFYILDIYEKDWGGSRTMKRGLNMKWPQAMHKASEDNLSHTKYALQDMNEDVFKQDEENHQGGFRE